MNALFFYFLFIYFILSAAFSVGVYIGAHDGESIGIWKTIAYVILGALLAPILFFMLLGERLAERHTRGSEGETSER